MQRSCASCGERFTAKNPRAKFCSDRCRKRAQRAPAGKAAKVAALPAPSQEESGLAAVTRRTLDAAGRLDTVLGQQAVALAVRIEQPGESGASVASLSKELRAVMAAAMEGVGAKADPLDELKARRERKRNAG